MTNPPTIRPNPAPTTSPPATRRPSEKGRWTRRPIWNRFTPLQMLVLFLATIPPVLLALTVGGYAFGIIPLDTMIDRALIIGEEPGMITFAAMFLASPVQWITGRTQIRIRKYLGIVFFLLALSNGAMFVLESGIGATFSEPFLAAGSIALLVSVPLFATSSRWSQRVLGMRRWRLIHRATYLVAVALVSHVVLTGEIGVGETLIIFGFVARVPRVKRRLRRRGASAPITAPTAATSLSLAR